MIVTVAAAVRTTIGCPARPPPGTAAGHERRGTMRMMDLSTVRWRKSSHSGSNGCVEVAMGQDQVAVRDTKDRGGPILVFTAVEWEAFLAGVKDGQFDRAT
jgi:Domain of unknown function (DUF397)